jgi:hypothetical protein
MYALVENGKITYRGALPTSWRNITGLANQAGNTAFLQPLGWLPLTIISPTLADNEVEAGEAVVATDEAVTITVGKVALSAAAAAQKEINRLEQLVTPRRMREALKDPTWVNEQDTLIAAQRSKL